MKNKRNRIVSIEEVGKFYVVDYADGLRLITGKAAAERTAAKRKIKKRRKK